MNRRSRQARLAGFYIDLIDLETGEQTVIAEQGMTLFSSGGHAPIVHGSDVCWISPFANALIVHDIASETQREIRLEY